jgi:ribonuclease-3
VESFQCSEKSGKNFPTVGKIMMKKFQALEKRIGYRFRKKALLETALTHPSYRYEHADTEADNQRLEFLGDSVLGFLAADALMREKPEADEGELTQLKVSLTSGSTLARVAAELELGEFLQLGRGESSDGGANRESNLEDALESLLGAIWLDGGLKASRKFFEKHIFPMLGKTEPVLVNPKGALQEYAQREGLGLPKYTVLEESGPDHDRVFKVQVCISTYGFTAEGRSRREAEKCAAEKAVRGLL